MDLQREQERRTYSLCRLGFGFLAFALIVAAVTTLIAMPRFFIFRPLFQGLMDSALWRWSDTPVVWGSLIGVYFLWGRWTDPSWQRRSGLLLLMSIVDLVLWFLTHGESLGLRLGNFGHQWLRNHIGEALGWAEFALMASLTCDVLIHLGVPRAAETGRATRSLAATGALLWMLLFFQMTNWQTWPLEGGRFRNIEMYLIFLGWNMIWTITLIQVTALTIAATRQCTAVIAEMDRQDQTHDLLKLPSEHEAFDPAVAGEEWNSKNLYRAPMNR
jgi:hypothetical protein